MGCNESRTPKYHYDFEIIENPTKGPGALSYNLSKLDKSFHEAKTLTSKTGLLSDYLLPVYGVKDDLYPYKSTLKKLGDNSFEDQEFPSSSKSIEQFQGQLKHEIKECTWKHPWEFLSANQKQIQVFEDKIEPNDIKMGDLQNCYFLAALSIISEKYPDLIRRLFVTPKFADLYCLYLNVQGHFKQICLNDQFPCFSEGGPIFSRCNGNELWVVLLEKAYAKIYGGYANIEVGTVSQAFRDLTGAPTDYIDNLNEEQTWWFIEQCHKYNYMMVAEFKKQSEGDPSIHFPIIDYKIDKEQKKIITIRNIVSQKLENTLNYQESDNNLKQLELKDFVSQFNSVCACKIHPNYFYSSYQLIEDEINEQKAPSIRLVLLKVSKNTHGFLTASQQDTRKHPNLAVQNGIIRLIVGKIDLNSNQITEFESAKMEASRDVYVECNFKIGTYVVYIEKDWNGEWDRSMVLSTYSQNPISMIEFDSNEELSIQLLNGLLQRNEGFKNDQSIKFNDEISRISGFAGGYLFFSYINNSIAITLNETVKLKNIKNLQICPPEVDNNTFIIQLKPGSQKIVKYRVNMDEQGELGYSASFSNQLIENYTLEQLAIMARTKPHKIVQRKLRGQPIEVYFSIFNHQNGIAFLYQNKSEKGYLEDLKLNLKNLKIEEPTDAPLNLAEEPVRIYCPPHQEFLISLKTVDIKHETSYSMSMQFRFD